MQSTTVAALTKTTTVPGGVERAFDLFTAEIGNWWPLPDFSVAGAESRGVTMDCRDGGRIVETLADGTETVWGTVTEWSPPDRVAFTWHPGQPAEEATAVEVSFRAVADTTEVVLVHSGWENRPDSVAARENYDTGWDIVLSHLAPA